MVCSKEEGGPSVASDGSTRRKQLLAGALTPGKTLGTLYTFGVGTNKTKQHVVGVVVVVFITFTKSSKWWITHIFIGIYHKNTNYVPGHLTETITSQPIHPHLCSQLCAHTTHLTHLHRRLRQRPRKEPWKKRRKIEKGGSSVRKT